MQYSSSVHYPSNASAQQMQQHLTNGGFASTGANNGGYHDDGQMVGESY
jgi:hypothetical protein